VAGASLSPGLAAMNDKAAAAGPFAGAAAMLEDLAGVRLTVKRAGRAAEASGAAAAEAVRERSALITARKLVPMPPSPLPGKLYAVIDGTGVPMTAKETAGRAGKGEDGRARTREVKLAVFFTRDRPGKDGYPVRDRDSASVIATFEPAGTFAGLVKAEGIRRGADHVRQLTILGDGAAWIWNLATSKFPGHPDRGPVPRPRAPPRPRPPAGIHARRPERRMARRPPGGPGLRRHRRDLQGLPRLPARGHQERRAGHGPGLLREQRAPHALPLVPPVRPVRRLRRRRGQLQDHRRPAPQTGRHALDHQGRRRHHRPALPRGRQHLGNHLQHPAHSDAHRLTSPGPKTISITYKIDVHPSTSAFCLAVRASVYRLTWYTASPPSGPA